MSTISLFCIICWFQKWLEVQTKFPQNDTFLHLSSTHKNMCAIISAHKLGKNTKLL